MAAMRDRKEVFSLRNTQVAWSRPGKCGHVQNHATTSRLVTAGVSAVEGTETQTDAGTQAYTHKNTSADRHREEGEERDMPPEHTRIRAQTEKLPWHANTQRLTWASKWHRASSRMRTMVCFACASCVQYLHAPRTDTFPGNAAKRQRRQDRQEMRQDLLLSMPLATKKRNTRTHL